MKTGKRIRTIIDVNLQTHSKTLDFTLYNDRQKFIDDIMTVFHRQDIGDWLETDTGQTYELTFKPTKK